MEPGGCLLTGQVVSGMKVARAWSGLLCGTLEPVAPRPRAASGAALACGRLVEGRPPSSGNCEGLSTERGTGADRLVVAVKVLSWGWSEGDGSSGLALRSTACGWEEPGERAEAEVV
jgi:hypothetical protein